MKCRKCGQCCRTKAVYGRRIIATNLYCPALDTSTMLCRIYANRAVLLKKLTGKTCAPNLKGWVPTGCSMMPMNYVGPELVSPTPFSVHAFAQMLMKNKMQRIVIDDYLASQKLEKENQNVESEKPTTSEIPAICD